MEKSLDIINNTENISKYAKLEVEKLKRDIDKDIDKQND
jgi:hypothetical protein